MNKIIKWTIIVIGCLTVLAFVGFQFMMARTKAHSPQETVTYNQNDLQLSGRLQPSLQKRPRCLRRTCTLRQRVAHRGQRGHRVHYLARPAHRRPAAPRGHLHPVDHPHRPAVDGDVQRKKLRLGTQLRRHLAPRPGGRRGVGRRAVEAPATQPNNLPFVSPKLPWRWCWSGTMPK